MRVYYLGALALFTALIFLVAPVQAAHKPSLENCAGKAVELGCYSKATSNKCGSVMGKSCYHEQHKQCSASEHGDSCINGLCRTEIWCNETFAKCCGKDGCFAYYNYTKGLTDYHASCPDGFKP